MRFRQVLERTLPLVLLSALLPARVHAGGSSGQRAPQAASKTAQQLGDEIEKHQAALRKVGPEARQEREDAVAQLLTMTDPRAHAVLQDLVAPGPDPDGVRRLVLDALPVRLRSPIDPAFGKNPNAVLLRRGYVAPLVVHFGDAPADSGAEGLRRLARVALMSVPTADLRAAIGTLLEVGSTTGRAQALRAAGQCRDVGLAPVLAGYLADKALGDIAREALYALTYVRFEDGKEFATWHARHGRRTYTELAEDAARRAKAEVEARVNASNERHLAAVVDLLDVLATSSRADKWERIQNQIFPRDTEGMAPQMAVEVTRAGLAKLRQVLSAAPVAANGPGRSERGAFFAELAKRLEAQPDPIDHALLLEVASYVCGATESAQRTAQQERLEAGLRHAAPAVRLSALRGLRRFFSPANRDRVLDVAVAALGAKDLKTLATAVATLQSEGWSAPPPSDPKFQDWVQGVRGILIDDDLPIELRQEVIPVLCLPDDKGRRIERSFQLLLDFVGREAVPAELRQSVILRLPGLIPTEQPARDAAAKQFVESLVALQSDNVAVEIRRAAATLLLVPESLSAEQQAAIGNDLVRSIGDRLYKEKDERVFGELIRVLQSQAEVEGLVAAVNTRLRQALVALGGKPEAENLAAAVRDGLRAVALKKGRAIAEWTATCEVLLTQRDRQTIRNILAFHLRGQGGQMAKDPKDDKERELHHRVWRVVIQSARLAPDDLAWSATANRGEAELVLIAMQTLMRDGALATKAAGGAPSLDDSRTRLTYLRCLHAVGQTEVLVKHATSWLQDSDKVLVNSDRDEARLLLAKAYIAQAKPELAWTASGIQSVEGGLLEARLDVQSSIAQTMQQRKNLKDAVAVLEDAVKKTPPAAEKYWPRFRVYLEYRFEADAKSGAGLLRELNDWVATGPKLTERQLKEVETLKSRLLGSAQPPK